MNENTLTILGCEGTDKITGFKGTITGHVKYITGSEQAQVQPKCAKGHWELQEAKWFDLERLDIAAAEGTPTE